MKILQGSLLGTRLHETEEERNITLHCKSSQEHQENSRNNALDE
jgi:hypothetical protein